MILRYGLLAAALILGGTTMLADAKLEPLLIENAWLIVTVAPDTGLFQIKEKSGGRTVVKDGQCLAGRMPVKQRALTDAVFGQGQSIDYAGASITLFKDLPFAIFRAALSNSTSVALTSNRVEMLSFTVEIGSPVKDLKILGTGGLSAPSAGVGSYSWLAVAEPATRRGVVTGWLTHNRASGIVFPKLQGDALRLSARADYGCLRLTPGAIAPMETLVVGYFEDARSGLEAYADAIAKVYQIKLPPQPNGHCTWYYAKALNERELPRLAEFTRKELAPFGYDFIQLDDGWQAGLKQNGPAKDFSTYAKNGPYKTKGMQDAAKAMQQQGQRPGLWLIPFAGTDEDPAFAERQHWFAKHTKDNKPYKVKWGGTCLDLTLPEVQSYLHDVIQRIVKEWGFSYLKLDGLWTGMATGIVYVNDGYREDNLGNAVFSNPDKTNVEAYRDGLKIVREAAGAETFILGCNVAQNMRTYGASFGLVDAMRVGPDNGSEWFLRGEYRLMAGPKTGTRSYFLNRRVWYNDPDPVFVRSSMPLNHAQLICSWVALAGQLVATSDNLMRLPPERLDMLRRIVPAHQATARPVDLFEEPVARIWLVTDEHTAVRRDVIGLFNWDDQDYRFDYPLKKIGLTDGTYVGFDYWGNRFVTPFQDKLELTLSPQACLVLAVRPTSDRPQLISTSRHVTQGMVDVLAEQWDGAGQTLSGVSQVVANDPYELRIILPAGYALRSAVAGGTAAQTTVEGQGLRVMFPETASGDVAWQIQFDKVQNPRK